jgi:hypothetical protein
MVFGGRSPRAAVALLLCPRLVWVRPLAWNILDAPRPPQYRSTSSQLVEWSGGATGLDQWLPVFLSFRASWQIPIRNRDRSCPRFPHPLCSSRTASFPQYGWKPALSLRALPQASPAAFDAEPASLSGLAQSPDVSVRGCAHRPLAQHGLLSPRLQTLLRPDAPV